MNETVDQHYVPRTHMKHLSVKRDNNYFIHAAGVPCTDNAPIKEVNIKKSVLKNTYIPCQAQL